MDDCVFRKKRIVKTLMRAEKQDNIGQIFPKTTHRRSDPQPAWNQTLTGSDVNIDLSPATSIVVRCG